MLRWSVSALRTCWVFDRFAQCLRPRALRVSSLFRIHFYPFFPLTVAYSRPVASPRAPRLGSPGPCRVDVLCVEAGHLPTGLWTKVDLDAFPLLVYLTREPTCVAPALILPSASGPVFGCPLQSHRGVAHAVNDTPPTMIFPPSQPLPHDCGRLVPGSRSFARSSRHRRQSTTFVGWLACRLRRLRKSALGSLPLRSHSPRGSGSPVGIRWACTRTHECLGPGSLLPLPSMGIGSPSTEGLASFFVRLAAAHVVPTNLMASTVPPGVLDTVCGHNVLSGRRGAWMNGTGRWVGSLASALACLTLQPHLSCFTMPLASRASQTATSVHGSPVVSRVLSRDEMYARYVLRPARLGAQARSLLSYPRRPIVRAVSGLSAGPAVVAARYCARLVRLVRC